MDSTIPSSYDKFPSVTVPGSPRAWTGSDAWQEAARHGTKPLVVDTYPGVELDELQKFIAEALPGLRRQTSADLALEGLPRERVLACAVRLLDLGFRTGEGQPDIVVAARRVEVDARRDRHAGLLEQTVAELHRVVGEEGGKPLAGGAGFDGREIGSDDVGVVHMLVTY